MLQELSPVWEKMKGESQKAYAAFCIYRDLGVARSQVKVSQELGKSVTLVARWSKKWQWVARTEAFDRYTDDELQKERMADVKDAMKQHTQMSRNLAVRTYNALAQMFDVDVNGAVTTRLNPTDLVRLNIAMVDLWRKSLGIPDRVQSELFVHSDTDQQTGKIIDQSILSDPVAREAAHTLIERLASGNVVPNGELES